MKKAMKILTLLLVCIMLLSVAACNNDNGGGGSDSTAGNVSGTNTSGDDGGGSSTNTNSGGGVAGGGESNPNASDTLVIATTSDRGTLDPAYARGGDVGNCLGMFYETLWMFDDEDNMVYKLATDLEIIEPILWKVKLREGVKFSNGNTFNADDVWFSLWRAHAREGHPNDIRYLDLDNTKVIDEYTIQIAFTQYTVGQEIGFGGFSAVGIYDKESYVEEDVPSKPIGTGPYYLDEYVVNSHVYLKAREDYWGEQPPIKNLNFVMFAEEAQRVNALQTAAIDICAVPFQDVEYVQTLPGYGVDILQGSLTQALYMNLAPTSIFHDNVDARMAVALAINQKALVNIAYNGYATASRYPASMANRDTDESFLDIGVYGMGYNVELAKEYAEKAGIVGKDMLLINNGSATNVTMCELIQESLREIGVNVTVQSLDQGSWLVWIFDDTKYDMCIDMVQSGTLSVANAFYSWSRIGTGGDIYRDPFPNDVRYRELLDTIMMVSDPVKLKELTEEMTKIHVDSVAWYALVDEQTATAYDSNLEVVRGRGNVILYNECYWK